VVCTSLAVVVLTWLLTWLTERVKLAELALVQLVVAVIAEPCFVTLGSLPFVLDMPSGLFHTVVDVDLTSHPIALTSSQNSPVCLSCSEFAADRQVWLGTRFAIGWCRYSSSRIFQYFDHSRFGILQGAVVPY
jgi:hypothetical protein